MLWFLLSPFLNFLNHPKTIIQAVELEKERSFNAECGRLELTEVVRFTYLLILIISSTQREYRSQPLKHSIVKRISALKR